MNRTSKVIWKTLKKDIKKNKTKSEALSTEKKIINSKKVMKNKPYK